MLIYCRKHADPTFNKPIQKTKKPQDEAQLPAEKPTSKMEMVSCDVCSEEFPSISKAITHKHKMHPDHDAKYFCPWCGKLFTLKVNLVSLSLSETETKGWLFPPPLNILSCYLLITLKTKIDSYQLPT